MTYDRATAFHESGHAVAYCHLQAGIERAGVHSAAEAAKTGFSGYCARSSLHAPGPLTAPLHVHQDIATREIICTLAGPVVSQRVGQDLKGSKLDIDEALKLVCIFWKDDPDDGVSRVKRLTDVANAFIREPEVWAQITAVADVLTEKGYISGKHPILRGIKRWRKLPIIQAPAMTANPS